MSRIKYERYSGDPRLFAYTEVGQPWAAFIFEEYSAQGGRYWIIGVGMHLVSNAEGKVSNLEVALLGVPDAPL